jgi:long-chain acyl-CoA synthetase
MLTAMLRRAVSADPSKLAVVCGRTRISYSELAERVARCAAGLRRLGIEPGECVAAALVNGPEFIIAFLATMSLRAIFLPLNPHYARGELQRFITDGKARVIIAGGPSLAVCRALAGEIESAVPLVVVGDAIEGSIPFGALSGPDEQRADAVAFAGRALYLYTSGSTDTYKRICCTQENLRYEALNFVETVGLTRDDTILCTVPLFHSYGIGNCLLDALYLGATLVILEPSSDEHGGDVPFVNQCGRVAELLRTEAVRFYPGVPYQFSVLNGLPQEFPIDFSGVRLCISSSDVLPKRTFERFFARFGQPIRSLYGSTEAGSIAIDCDPKERFVFGSLGQPLRNVTIEIHDSNGMAPPRGQEGDIWVKSPTIPSSGYDNRPALNEEVFRAGFYRTGDVGTLDADGRLRISGRRQNFVDIAGYKVDIGEVEEVLHECPGVAEAAAIGVTIPSMGTLIKAAVVAKDGWDEDDIRAFCRERLAFVKVPRIIELRDALPRSSTGKVVKSELGDVGPFLAGIRDPATVRAIRKLSVAFPEQRRRLLRSIVQAQAAAVLGRRTGDVPDDLGFTDLGMDSFASIELRARLEFLLERAFPETITFDHPTVAAVVEYLLPLFAGPDSDIARREERLTP